MKRSKPDLGTDYAKKPLPESSPEVVETVVAGARIELATQGFSGSSDPSAISCTYPNVLNLQSVTQPPQKDEHTKNTKT